MKPRHLTTTRNIFLATQCLMIVIFLATAARGIAQVPGQHKTIHIISPESVNPLKTAPAKLTVRFSKSAGSVDFRAFLNRRDVTDKFKIVKSNGLSLYCV